MNTATQSSLVRAIDLLCRGLRFLVGGLMILLAIPVAQQVIARYTGLLPVYLWTEELATFLFVWVVMIGSMLAVWDGTHFDVEVIPTARRPTLRLVQLGFVQLMIFGFGLMFAVYGIEYAKFGALQHTVMMGANKLWTFISVPVAGAFWALFAGAKLWLMIVAYRAGELSGDAEDREMSS
ncbi:TRAP-type C4-dicarboxylate transport system, small permease component [Ruegeria intermedia]|uniref:TRAP transporter small permease protein n=1 Tax=Ruegeria intermedia TaxID=996115 RepID=A0A1M4ZJB5_9RHOB|nr:TRAP transporter small permease subunit [Ruegeria intermedia]SHF18129.1 TRAP-type C4-dicarboxylate transport system, small permease component [Ruegeria intermedia]